LWLRDSGRAEGFSVEERHGGWITTHSYSSLDEAIDQARGITPPAKGGEL
jgi:hypothetical protein